MKILAITDIHGDIGSAEKLRNRAWGEGVDIVVIAGDITGKTMSGFGTLDDAIKMLKVFHPYPTFFIPGNCDPPSLTEVDSLNNAHCVHGKPRSVQGFYILGVGGGVTSPFKTPFEQGEEQFTETLRTSLTSLKADGKLVFITHMPPKDTELDLVTPLGPHVGSIAVRRFIEQQVPLITVCGHMHERRGVDKVGNTLVLNPGPASRGFYAFISLNGMPDIRLGKV